MSAIIKKAHQIRKDAANKFGGKPGQYSLKIACEMAKNGEEVEMEKKMTTKIVINTVKEAIMGLSIFQAAEEGHIIGVKHKDLHYNFGNNGVAKYMDTPMPCYAGDVLSAKHAVTGETIEVTVASIEAHHSEIYATVIMGGKSQLWDICRISKMIADGICTVR